MDDTALRWDRTVDLSLSEVSEAAKEALRDGFERVGLEEIVSFTTLTNLKSRRVMEKLGMQHCPDQNFDHPMVSEGHSLRRHVLYRMGKANWSAQS
jgi:RimJ/RimL family protein N-acetyltransferase